MSRPQPQRQLSFTVQECVTRWNQIRDPMGWLIWLETNHPDVPQGPFDQWNEKEAQTVLGYLTEYLRLEAQLLDASPFVLECQALWCKIKDLNRWAAWLERQHPELVYRQFEALTVRQAILLKSLLSDYLLIERGELLEDPLYGGLSPAVVEVMALWSEVKHMRQWVDWLAAQPPNEELANITQVAFNAMTDTQAAVLRGYLLHYLGRDKAGEGIWSRASYVLF